MPRYSMNDAAKLCGKARSTIQRAVHSGKVPLGDDGLLDTADLVRARYLAPEHEHDPIPPRQSVTLRRIYELNLNIFSLLQTISQQLGRLLSLLEPSPSQPAARPKKRPPGPAAQPC